MIIIIIMRNNNKNNRNDDNDNYGKYAQTTPARHVDKRHQPPNILSQRALFWRQACGYYQSRRRRLCPV